MCLKASSFLSWEIPISNKGMDAAARAKIFFVELSVFGQERSALLNLCAQRLYHISIHKTVSWCFSAPWWLAGQRDSLRHLQTCVNTLQTYLVHLMLSPFYNCPKWMLQAPSITLWDAYEPALCRGMAELGSAALQLADSWRKTAIWERNHMKEHIMQEKATSNVGAKDWKLPFQKKQWVESNRNWSQISVFHV